ncbi:MAG: hypothetical protein WAL80_24670 [Xanthobacteraceae bacterium]|jgi:hypothetical protein
MLRAPNIALFVTSGCLAMMGVLSALPIGLPIPGIASLNGASAWYIFDAWFLLAIGSVLPERSAPEPRYSHAR